MMVVAAVVVVAVSTPSFGLSGWSLGRSVARSPTCCAVESGECTSSCHNRGGGRRARDRQPSLLVLVCRGSAPGSRCGKGNRVNGVGLGRPSYMWIGFDSARFGWVWLGWLD